MTAGRTLAAGALALGALAAAAGSPYPSARGQIDVDALATMILQEEDHLDAAELGTWIRDRKTGLRVIDLRSADEFDAYHVPSAENVPLNRIGRTRFAEDETVVMYSQGGAHAAQAWVLLRARGLKHVYFLSGGLDEWATEVMNPLLPDDASPAERAQFERVAEISRYFGGTPHTGPRGDGRDTAAGETLARLKRRGC